MTTTRARPTVTIEDGWRTIIDGMTMHRWFLAPHRHLDRLLAERWADLTAKVGGLPDLPALRRRWTRAALLQLTHPEQPAAEVRTALREGRSESPAPLAVRAARRLANGGLLVPPASLGASDPDLAAAVTRALALLRVAGLEPLRRVAVEIVAAVDEPPPHAEAWRIGESLVPVDIDSDDIGLMVQIGCGAALQYLHGIWAYYSKPGEGNELVRSPLSGREVTVADLAAEAIGAGTAHRLLTELVRRHGPDGGTLDKHLDIATEQVRVLAPVVYQTEFRIELTCFETVNVSFPGPRQFEKYERGYGLGQS
jgi:hypothetical protein